MFIGWLEILTALYVPRWEKRKEHVKCCIKNCTEAFYVIIHCWIFSAPKLHTSALAAILYAFMTPYPPINELAIVTALSRQPARPYWKNSFPTGNGHRVRREDCFLNLFVHMQEDSSGPPRAYQGVEPPPVLLFLLKQNPSPKDIV